MYIVKTKYQRKLLCQREKYDSIDEYYGVEEEPQNSDRWFKDVQNNHAENM